MVEKLTGLGDGGARTQGDIEKGQAVVDGAVGAGALLGGVAEEKGGKADNFGVVIAAEATTLAEVPKTTAIPEVVAATETVVGVEAVAAAATKTSSPAMEAYLNGNWKTSSTLTTQKQFEQEYAYIGKSVPHVLTLRSVY